MPKITVIIPVYKVESYLHRCIDSVLNQTYQNFELVLIDDGSPDNCGVICDEYALKDSRIHVIHQENKGLSGARNAGIDWAFENSDSRWLTFIDSDDWVHREYLQKLLEYAEMSETKLVTCTYQNVSEWFPDKKLTSQEECFTIDAEDALIQWDYVCMTACCKMVSKELYSDIRFPMGKLHEDAFISHIITCRAKRITILNAPLYYYFFNPQSITKVQYSSKRIVEVEAHEIRLKYYKENDYERAYKYQLRACVNVIRYHIDCLLESREKIKDHITLFNMLCQKLKKIWPEVKNDLTFDRDYIWLWMLVSIPENMLIWLSSQYEKKRTFEKERQRQRQLQNKNEKTTIMLIPQTLLPIPAVGGGAVEQLITHLLEENEREHLINLVVVSKSDMKAQKYQFNHSKIYYIDDQNFSHKDFPFLNLEWIVYQIWLKAFRNHIVTKFIPEKYPRMDKYAFLCYHIAKKEKVNAISLEGVLEEERFARLNNLVGEENLYKHLHYAQAEDMDVRKVIYNSISISQYVRSQWVKNYSVRGNNVVLYNCADISKFGMRVSDQDREARRREYGVGPEESLVLYCGRIIPEKGVLELIECMEQLRNEPIKLLLVGSVSFSLTGTSAYQQEVNRWAAELPSVICTGYIPNDELARLASLADMQVIPSTCQEGAGLVAIEGMAAGLPLIITDSGGMVEYVDDESAIKLPINEELPQNLARTIMELHNDPERRKQMGLSGRCRAQKFSSNAYYQDFAKIFQN